MKLLIDAGNSRIKWGVYSNGQWLAQEAVSHENISSLQQAWSRWEVRAVFGASVVKQSICDALEAQATKPIHWASTGVEMAGVRNHYHQPAQMGVDRWLAVVAAHKLLNDDAIIASVGTCMTIESLRREGDYLGGMLMPGYSLMLEAMAQKFSRLNVPVGDWTGFPCSTQDAIATGTLEAMAGAVERARDRLATETGRQMPIIVLTGGDAGRLAPVLASPVKIVDNLVLTGLLEVADKI